jgi:hypothetical protein
MLFELEDAIELLGKRDVVGCDAPYKTAGRTKTLGFGEKCCTVFEFFID